MGLWFKFTVYENVSPRERQSNRKVVLIAQRELKPVLASLGEQPFAATRNGFS